uniref:Uncharacterized protein n=1 Tax=Arundo donax TaxID=35708 RepID=A0A0A8XYS8_ARUDO
MIAVKTATPMEAAQGSKNPSMVHPPGICYPVALNPASLLTLSSCGDCGSIWCCLES